MIFKNIVLGIFVIIFVGCSKTISQSHNRDTNVTIYSIYNKHFETKGRGVVLKQEGIDGEWVLTAAHVLNEYGTPKYIWTIDNDNLDHFTLVKYIFKRPKDLALVWVAGPLHKETATLGGNEFGDSLKENVYAFSYPKDTKFNDESISHEITKGQVIVESKILGVDDPIFGVVGDYHSQQGMSGGGLYNDKGELVGIHNATNIMGWGIFTPIRESVRDERVQLEKVLGEKTFIELFN